MTAGRTFAPNGLMFYASPSCEENHSIGGLCEYGMAAWTNTTYPGCGAYNISLTGAPSGQNWGNYFYFGGGQAWSKGGTGTCGD